MSVKVLDECLTYVHNYFPDAHSVTKNFYHYVVSDNFPGNTIGSGETRLEAWKMAMEAVEEWAASHKKEDL